MNRRMFLRLSRASALAGTAWAAWGWPVLGRGQTTERSREKIRVGQIGVGHAHADGKMASLRKLADYEVVGVVEPDSALRERARTRIPYQGLRWMTEEELLNAPGLRAVAVETEVKDLLPTASRVIAAGKHLHLDKPAGESLTEFKSVLEEAARRHLTVQMGYMFRHNPAFQLCFQAVREGWLGRVFSVDALMGKVLDPASRQALLAYPGGAMFELGCHVIDAVVRVLGRPQKVTAFARSSSRRKDTLADNQTAVLEYPNATAVVRANFVEVEGFARRQFVVCGDEGTMDIRPLEPPHGRLALASARGAYRKGYQEIEFPNLPRYDEGFVELARAIRGEQEYAYQPEHDLAVQETVLLASGLPLN